MFLTRLGYRIRYYAKEFCEFFGYCGSCGLKLSITGKGRKICTNINCSRR